MKPIKWLLESLFNGATKDAKRLQQKHETRFKNVATKVQHCCIKNNHFKTK